MGCGCGCEGKGRGVRPEGRRMLAYTQPVDLRKSIQGGGGVVKPGLGEDPVSGRGCVFRNRRGTYLN